MKIEQQGYSGGTQGTGRAAGTAYSQFRNAGPGASIGDHGDQANVSQVAKVYQTAEAARVTQVGRLEGLVRSGSYNVDPGLVSQSLVTETIAATVGQ